MTGGEGAALALDLGLGLIESQGGLGLEHRQGQGEISRGHTGAAEGLEAAAEIGAAAGLPGRLPQLLHLYLGPRQAAELLGAATALEPQGGADQQGDSATKTRNSDQPIKRPRRGRAI